MTVAVPKYEDRFIEKNACVLIPTYNNAQVLATVIENVLQYTLQIIVVCDGSTDNTLEILKTFPEIDIISYKKNIGKGFALRKGMKHALDKGYKYAISMDSDGQHLGEDLIHFLNQSDKNPQAIIVGARNMENAKQAKSSSFANRFSNFWFHLETGIKLPDTQSGYRLYPLQKLANRKYFSTKYEFEIEILVRAAWRLIPVISVPIQVLYPVDEKRITHFRAGRDFTRISILNTVLVIIMLLFGRPAMFVRKIRRTNFKTFFKERIIESSETNLKLSLSAAFGIFMGILPIWGWQLISAIGLAYIFKLNKPIVIVTANISIPPNIPVLLFLSYYTGAILTGHNLNDIIFDWSFNFEMIKRDFFMYLIGSVVFAIFSALITGLLSFLVFSLLRRKK
jgi:glycosyltransferase involved in cell wall biosynthesis